MAHIGLVTFLFFGWGKDYYPIISYYDAIPKIHDTFFSLYNKNSIDNTKFMLNNIAKIITLQSWLIVKTSLICS